MSGLPNRETPETREQERKALAAGADILLTVLTFNEPLQPVRLEVLECEEVGLVEATR